MTPETMRVAPRFLIVRDSENPVSERMARSLGGYESEKPEAILVIGGDGMMLHAIRRYWRKRLPFVGLNAGHRGFLMNNSHSASKIFDHDLIVRSSPLLEVTATKPDGKTRTAYAFNDAHVRVKSPRAGWFEVVIDGEVRLPKLVADGVLVATAAGSTAYANSMGAHPVPVGTEVLIVVGSNVSEPASWRSGANVPLDSEIVVRNADSTRWRKIYGVADSANLGEVAEMRIRASEHRVRILFTPDNDLRKKLAVLQFPALDERKTP